MNTGVMVGIGVAVVFVAVVVLFYNALVRGKNRLDEAWSGIDVQLRRRHDLVPNLVAAVGQYARHEQDVLAKVSDARARSMAVRGDVAAQAQAENVLSGALRGLLAVAEAYPDLKASENFRQMQNTLGTLEDEIQMARRYYNGTAREQNDRVRQFPGNMVAHAFGFAPVAYFELDSPAERAVPSVGELQG